LWERPIGFALLNEDCEIEKRLPPEAVVGDVLHSPQMMLGVVEDVSGRVPIHVRVADAAPRTDTAIPFRFRLMEDDAEAFTLCFEPEQRIGDVRAAIGRVLEADKDSISLFLRGGALNDRFLVRRVRIKDAEIGVSVS
jgi:hypothetical protein